MGEKRDILRISLQAVLAGGLGFLMMYIIGPMMDKIEKNTDVIQEHAVMIGRQQEQIRHLEAQKK